MDRIQEILSRLGGSGTTFNKMTPREYEQFKADGLNATEGTRHLEDGYHCDACKNKGYIIKVVEDDAGSFHQVCSECKCEPVRRSIMRMKRSGLKDIITDYTFAKYEANEPWQQALKSAAMAYAKNPKGWFFLGGQSGCGKTHLCTAICREFLLEGKQVVYMLWRDDIANLKGVANDPELRMPMINRFKQAEVLYIDDLFKTGKEKDGTNARPSSADINAAFEILNYRYCNPDLLTIISTEMSEGELFDVDEATGGRIFEKSGSNGFSIAKDRSRNYRTKKAVTV